MAKGKKLVVPLAQLHAKLREYHAEFDKQSSTEKGHVYWSRPLSMWMLVLRKGSNAEITFHHDCPCSLI